ncbi:polyphenol oxidase family protein [Luteococcus peritonei]|uniref:Polyphenol oxidase family protein n=1 Tax=Luteococcus peritonei TaxID=88874 RepID=A0ABW4RR69_9ACTN
MFSFLERSAGVGVAFTDRHGGVSDEHLGPLNLGRTDVDGPEAVGRNGELVAAELGVRHWVATHQVHGAEVLVVDRDFLSGWGPRSWLGADAGQPPLVPADAMVTVEPSTALVIRVADCVPVLLAAVDGSVVGAAHAGRAGFDLGVLQATVEQMRELGAGPIRAWIGPHVCGECYEVPDEMAAAVEARHPGVAVRSRWGSAALDLGAGCAAQLAALGIAAERRDPCTLTTTDLHSHRRDAERAGRLAGIIWRVS